MNIATNTLAVARIYLRVSAEDQDLKRQDALFATAKAAGYYIGEMYRKKASGVRADRPELLRMIDDLQPGETVIAEAIDRISRLPLPEAEKLIATIRGKGAGTLAAKNSIAPCFVEYI
jgi:DNA invertase Pin-like site-specific DNA recombinase